MANDQQIEIGTQHAKNVTFGVRGRAGDTYRDGSRDKPDEEVRRPHDAAEKARQVFVIHGRDEETREAVFELLRALNLRPMEWEHLVAETGVATPSLAEVVSRASTYAQAVVAVLTPDDIVALHPELCGPDDIGVETATACQARPNVYLELGMALAIHPGRTIILEVGRMRRPADLAGLNYVRVAGSAGWCNKVAERLQNAGCPVDRSGADWQRTDRFSRLAAHQRRPPDRDV